MEFFKSIIGILAYAALGFSATAAYLKINKIWKRRHIAEVANSVSIAGNVVDLIPLTFFALNFLFVAQWQGLIDSLIWIVAGAVSVLIGSGLWVSEKRGKSFWKRVLEALKLERQEVGDLAAALFRPSSAKYILDILGQFAWIDRSMAERERGFIQAFCDNWNMSVDWAQLEKLSEVERTQRLVSTRESVSQYLKTSPSTDQVLQLIDVLEALIETDETVTEQESLIFGEVRGQMLDYQDASQRPELFDVVIVPQNEKQDEAIDALLPHVRKTAVAGGIGYLVDSFYSKAYAEMICEQYRNLGYFTVDLLRQASGQRVPA